MLNEVLLVQVDLTPEYKQNLLSLAKRFPHIRSDTQETVSQILAGNFVGDKIFALGENYLVLKVGIKNTDIADGETEYRLIYQVESLANVLLLSIYSKSDEDDIGFNQIVSILSDY
jgi:mRNA-degrading endonuclease RelE of RelBE toxin-antitoxin system